MKVAFVINIKNFVRGIAPYQVNILKIFSKNYELIVLSNAVDLIKRLGINAKFIRIPKFFFPDKNFNLFANAVINLKLQNLDYDILAIWYNSLIFFNSKKPTIRFVSISPYQSIGYTDEDDALGFIQKIKLKAYINSFKKSSLVLTVSPQLKEWLINLGINPRITRWFPHGVDLEKFQNNISENQEDYILINTGKFIEERGANLIIKSMKKLVSYDRNIKYISIGNENYEIKKWRTIISDNKLDNNINLLGYIDHQEIPKYLSKAKIGISMLEPNIYYSQSPPQKIFEYMAAGLPTIANNIPTHTEFIKDGYNGFIVNSVEEFVNITIKLKEDKQLYKKISNNAIKSVTKYDIAYIEKEIKNLIKNCIYDNTQ